MAQVGSLQPQKAEAWVRFEDFPSRMCGGHSEVL
jgi:hypothetical protein